MACPVYGCRFNTSHTLRNHRCGKCKICGHGQMECGNTQKIQALYVHWDEEMPTYSQCTLGTCGENKKYHTMSSHECKFCQALHAETSCKFAPKFNIIDCPLCSKKNCVPKDQKKIFGSTDVCKVCAINPVQIFLPECGHTVLCKECFCDIMGIEDATNESEFEHLYNDQMKSEALGILKNIPGKVYCIINAGMGCSWFIRRKGVTAKLQKFFMHSDNYGQYGPGTDDRPKLEVFISGYMLIKND